MEIKRGIGVSPGVAIGPALVLDSEWFRIPKTAVGANDRVGGEGLCERLRLAPSKSAADEETRRTRKPSVRSNLGNLSTGHIFAAHAMLLADPELGTAKSEAQIREPPSTVAEYAISQRHARYAKAPGRACDDGYGSNAASPTCSPTSKNALLRHLLRLQKARAARAT